MLSERRTPAATSAELHALEAEAEELIAADGQEDVGEILARLEPWWKQLTLRGLCVGVVLAFLFTVVSFKLVLGPGVIPSLNIAAGLLGFCGLRTWRAAASAMGLHSPEGTAQETNVVQTFITASISVAYTGGFGMYLAGLDRQTYENIGGSSTPGNRIEDVYEPELIRTIPYLMVTSVVGVFMLVFLRKLLIIDYGLQYPSGTATGLLITSFHTAKGATAAVAQMGLLLTSFAASFAWDAVKWLFSSTTCAMCSSSGAACGGIAVFGQAAAAWTWNFDGQLQLIGAGMICPYMVNVSMLLGAMLSWCYLWPLISSKEGDWYPAGLGDKSFSGLLGYKVFIMVSVFIADGAYQIVKIVVLSVQHARKATPRPATPTVPARAASRAASRAATQGHAVDIRTPLLSSDPCARAGEAAKGAAAGGDGGVAGSVGQGLVGGAASEWGGLPVLTPGSTDAKGRQAAAAAAAAEDEDSLYESAHDRELRCAVFNGETIPWIIPVVGYLSFTVAGVLVIPRLYPEVKHWMVLLAYIIGPIMSLPNSYGMGLTDWDMSTIYGKIGIFAFAGLVGSQGGVTVGLVMCGVLLASTSTAATLMQDFRTGYLTLSAPRAMFATQVLGSLCGVIMAPLTFQMFLASGKVGVAGGPYPVPIADLYRSMAIFGTEGWSVLPQHCPALMALFFTCALLLNALKDTLPRKLARCVPNPTAFAIPFYIGAALAVDMCTGSLVLWLWERLDPHGAPLLAPAVASGLIVGDGLWSLPACALQVLGVRAPLCVAGWRRFGRVHS
ncbi:MAG: hypothetical protein WDW36_006976 [Sanguina aurantia]